MTTMTSLAVDQRVMSNGSVISCIWLTPMKTKSWITRNCLHFQSTRVHPRFLVLYIYVLSILVCPFSLFLLAIVLSVLLRYTNSDYTFGISKLFLISWVTLNTQLTSDRSIYIYRNFSISGCLYAFGKCIFCVSYILGTTETFTSGKTKRLYTSSGEAIISIQVFLSNWKLW